MAHHWGRFEAEDTCGYPGPRGFLNNPPENLWDQGNVWTALIIPWLLEVPRSRQPTTLAVTARGWARGLPPALQALLRPQPLAARIVSCRERGTWYRGTSGTQGTLIIDIVASSPGPAFLLRHAERLRAQVRYPREGLPLAADLPEAR